MNLLGNIIIRNKILTIFGSKLTGKSLIREIYDGSSRNVSYQKISAVLCFIEKNSWWKMLS